MKIVTFTGNKEKIFLTDREFEEGIKYWEEKRDYFCQRLQARISPHISLIKTPELQLTHDIFVAFEPPPIGICDIAKDKKTGVYYSLNENEDDNGFHLRKKMVRSGDKWFLLRDSSEEECVKKYLEGMTPIEDYFNKNRAVESAILIRLS